MTDHYIQQLAVKYKNALIKENIPVNAVYLFGSYAKGNQTKASDIDFCVVSKSFGKNDFEEMVAINQIAKLISADIEAFPVSQDDYAARANPFIAEAMKTGKRLI